MIVLMMSAISLKFLVCSRIWSFLLLLDPTHPHIRHAMAMTTGGLARIRRPLNFMTRF